MRKKSEFPRRHQINVIDRLTLLFHGKPCSKGLILPKSCSEADSVTGMPYL